MLHFNSGLAARLILVTVSGLMAYPAIKLDSFLTPDRYPPVFSWWLILHGVLFGALVMAPFVSTERHRGLRRVALTLSSVFSYYLAITFASLDGFAILTEPAQYILAGVTGAVLVATATRFIAPLKIRTAFWILVVSAGLAGGALFSVTSSLCFWDKCADWWRVPPYSAGWIFWQVLVFLAMYMGSERDSGDCT
jgi:hypothetical protein